MAVKKIKIPQKKRAPRNRTITIYQDEVDMLQNRLIQLDHRVQKNEIIDTTINQDIFDVLDYLPDQFVDLLFIDPPYNLNKVFNTNSFREMKNYDYEDYLDSWMSKMLRLLKPTASVYICGDWKSTSAIYNVMSRYFTIRNRISWEREKGRGAKANWKNAAEDIWYGTVSDEYFFDVHAVKVKRRVVAPYRDDKGKPKDWNETENGNFRLTHPSNVWTDLTVPYWSMPENTDHPTQKPEKLLAKIILASSKEGDVIFDPFLGSGTTSVVAKKLGRNYCGIEIDPFYAVLTEKRLELAEEDCSIQGYSDGVFWERNSLAQQKKAKSRAS